MEEEWKLVDPILEAWKDAPAPPTYEAGSQGPAAADELLAVRGRKLEADLSASARRPGS